MASEPVSIVIPSWNGINLLKKFLPSVLEPARNYHQSHSPSTDMVVVDDGSTAQSVTWLEQMGFQVSGGDQSDFASRAAASSRRADSQLRGDSSLRGDSLSPADSAPRAGLSPRLLVVARANNEGF